MMWSRSKIYKGNRQAIRIIVMTKHFIWSFSNSLLLLKKITLLHIYNLFLFAWIIFIKIYWIYLKVILYLQYSQTDLILVLTMFYWEQKYTGMVIMPSVYVFNGNKKILTRTKIYRSELENNLLLHRNNKLVWTWVNEHNFDTERNYHLCCGYQQEKNCFPQRSLCVFSNN